MPYFQFMRYSFQDFEGVLCQHAFVIRHRRAWPGFEIRHIGKHQIEEILVTSGFSDELFFFLFFSQTA